VYKKNKKKKRERKRTKRKEKERYCLDCCHVLIKGTLVYFRYTGLAVAMCSCTLLTALWKKKKKESKIE